MLPCHTNWTPFWTLGCTPMRVFSPARARMATSTCSSTNLASPSALETDEEGSLQLTMLMMRPKKITCRNCRSPQPDERHSRPMATTTPSTRPSTPRQFDRRTKSKTDSEMVFERYERRRHFDDLPPTGKIKTKGNYQALLENLATQRKAWQPPRPKQGQGRFRPRLRLIPWPESNRPSLGAACTAHQGLPVGSSFSTIPRPETPAFAPVNTDLSRRTSRRQRNWN